MNKWISVTKELPPNNSVVYVKTPDCQFKAFYNYQEKKWYYPQQGIRDIFGWLKDITHWFPLSSTK